MAQDACPICGTERVTATFCPACQARDVIAAVVQRLQQHDTVLQVAQDAADAGLGAGVWECDVVARERWVAAVEAVLLCVAQNIHED